ncbi:MAG: hypothetical protein IT269_11020 [Saprospiraceae bacterium]|nr:hypothetical protein [Saprospiraceae bacterium]
MAAAFIGCNMENGCKRLFKIHLLAQKGIFCRHPSFVFQAEIPASPRKTRIGYRQNLLFLNPAVKFKQPLSIYENVLICCKSIVCKEKTRFVILNEVKDLRPTKRKYTQLFDQILHCVQDDNFF